MKILYHNYRWWHWNSILSHIGCGILYVIIFILILFALVFAVVKELFGYLEGFTDARIWSLHEVRDDLVRWCNNFYRAP